LRLNQEKKSGLPLRIQGSKTKKGKSTFIRRAGFGGEKKVVVGSEGRVRQKIRNGRRYWCPDLEAVVEDPGHKKKREKNYTNWIT